MKRRNFIKNSAVLAATPIPTMLEQLAAERPYFQAAPGFSLKILNTNWGFAGSRDAFFNKTKEAGYDGVELWVPQEDADRDDLLSMASKYGLEFGLLCAKCTE